MGRRQLNGKVLAGYVFAAATLAWVFHDVGLAPITTMLSGLGAIWLLPAVACDVLSYICQGERWRLLLHPVGDLPLREAVKAIYAGLFTNEIVPLRLGEVVRAYAAGKAMRRPATSLIPSIAVERLIDSFWMAAGISLVLLFVPLPHDFARAAELFGSVIAALVVLFVCLVGRPPASLMRWSETRQSRLRSITGSAIAGIVRVGLNGRLAAAVGWSLALLLLQAAAFWLVMIACNLPLSYGAAAAVFLIVHLGTALPNAPANVGAFQFFTVMGLQLFGVDKSTAAAFSVVVFAVLTFPLWVLGLAAVSSTGVTLARIRAAAGAAEKPMPGVAPETYRSVERVWPEKPF